MFACNARRWASSCTRVSETVSSGVICPPRPASTEERRRSGAIGLGMGRAYRSGPRFASVGPGLAHAAFLGQVSANNGGGTAMRIVAMVVALLVSTGAQAQITPQQAEIVKDDRAAAPQRLEAAGPPE